MNVYMVREIETKTLHGIIWANSKGDLWDTFDEFGDPFGYEFAKLTSPGGFVHPRDGVSVPQWSDLDDDHEEGKLPWNEFEESECFSIALGNQHELKWEAFCHAGEKYGLLARIQRQVETNDNESNRVNAA